MKTSQKKIVETLLESHGRTYAEEIGIKLASQTPSALFQWLCASVLFSARISTHAAVTASKALFKQGWRTPQKMAATSWKERTRVLNQSGYARYDERTSTMLGKDADLVLSKYKGDLRKLREQAGRDPKEERKLLKGFKAIGDVGVAIFFREVQGQWEEIFPFADKRALRVARALQLGADETELSRLVRRDDFPKLVAALVRCDLAGDHEKILTKVNH